MASKSLYRLYLLVFVFGGIVLGVCLYQCQQPPPHTVEDLTGKIKVYRDSKLMIIQDEDIPVKIALDELRKAEGIENEINQACRMLSEQDKATIAQAKRDADSLLTNEAQRALRNLYEEEIDILYNQRMDKAKIAIRELQKGRQCVIEEFIEALPQTNQDAIEESPELQETEEKLRKVLKRIESTGSPF